MTLWLKLWAVFTFLTLISAIYGIGRYMAGERLRTITAKDATLGWWSALVVGAINSRAFEIAQGLPKILIGIGQAYFTFLVIGWTYMMGKVSVRGRIVRRKHIAWEVIYLIAMTANMLGVWMLVGWIP